jgi:hypothetical protein
MAKTLTIVIKDIPDKIMSNAWRDAKKYSMVEFGLEVEQADVVEIEYEYTMESQFELIPELIAGAMTGHLITTFNKMMNQTDESNSDSKV